MPLTNTEMGKSNHLDQTFFSPDHFSQVFQQNFYLNIIKNMKLGKRDFKQSLQTVLTNTGHHHHCHFHSFPFYELDQNWCHYELLLMILKKSVNEL